LHGLGSFCAGGRARGALEQVRTGWNGLARFGRVWRADIAHGVWAGRRAGKGSARRDERGDGEGGWVRLASGEPRRAPSLFDAGGQPARGAVGSPVG
jgi:hypothetical protein